ncbi:aldolase/citrate lyase family protein [Lachnospiraceae bacterium 62-35]
MKIADIKEKLKAGDKVLGTMITVFQNPDIIKIMKQCGYDYVLIDCEHGCFEYGEVARLLGMARAFELPAVVRIAEPRRELILKYMEMGADGLLLPGTETKEEAEMLVRYSKYAPLGERGVSLSRPHTDFGAVNGREYMDKVNKETILMCQIESKKGVDHIEEIIGTEGIDVAFVGPNDLSQDLGILGDYDNPVMIEAYEKVLQAAKKAGKSAGIHFGKKEPLVPWIKAGYQMNMCGADVSSLMSGAKAAIEYLAKETA